MFCAIWCKSKIFIMLYVVLVAVLYWVGYMRAFLQFGCGVLYLFVRYFDYSNLVYKSVFAQLKKGLK